MKLTSIEWCLIVALMMVAIAAGYLGFFFGGAS